MHSPRHLCASKASVPKHMNQQQIAQIVFEQLDVDKSGNVDAGEVTDLLVMWGLPVDDVNEVIESVDIDCDRQISFEEFLKNARTQAISEFAYKVMLYNGTEVDALLSERRVEPLHDVFATLSGDALGKDD